MNVKIPSLRPHTITCVYFLRCVFRRAHAISISMSRFSSSYEISMEGYIFVRKWYTGMRRITTFRSTTARIYDSGLIRL
jgi:hypothetical protein